MKKSLFPAKILLFGEYGVIKDSKGLSIPHDFYQGSFSFKKNKNINFLYSNHEIKKYYKFLFSIFHKQKIIKTFRMKDFFNDLKNGMYFNSNIPQKYGIGSSGALVAAIYENYNNNKIIVNKKLNRYDFYILKNIFSIMESYFHGKSSGIDPLICYLKFPLLIKSSKEIFRTCIPKEKKNGMGGIFLINSFIQSSTSNMIKIFFEKLKQDKFKQILQEEFTIYNNKCIDSFLNGNFEILLKNIKMLSICVYNNFLPMIPIFLYKIWEYGIFTNNYYLKLCGSGGGGFLLGFTKNFNFVKKKLKLYNPEIIFRF